jgi:hypothetical protein
MMPNMPFFQGDFCLAIDEAEIFEPKGPPD